MWRIKRYFTNIFLATMAKLNSDKMVSLTVIDKICKYLNCNIEDVMQYESKKKERK